MIHTTGWGITTRYAYEFSADLAWQPSYEKGWLIQEKKDETLGRAGSDLTTVYRGLPPATELLACG